MAPNSILDTFDLFCDRIPKSLLYFDFVTLWVYQSGFSAQPIKYVWIEFYLVKIMIKIKVKYIELIGVINGLLDTNTLNFSLATDNEVILLVLCTM